MMVDTSLIKPHRDTVSLRKRKYNTGDIVGLVQEVLYTDRNDTAAFSEQFPPTARGMRKLFDFVDRSFQYEEDPKRNQWVQTPSYLMHKTRKGDCKSFTVFISSVLQNMGVPHIIRYVGYGLSKRLVHVYPVAIINGKELPLDVVWKKQEGGPFGKEKRFTYKKDYKVQGLYKLGTTKVQAVNKKEIELSMRQMEAALADIPDSIITEGVGDITTFSVGELDRFIWADRYRAFALHEPNPRVKTKYLDAAVAMDRGTIAGIGSLVKDPFGQQVERIIRSSGNKTAKAFPDFGVRIPKPSDAQIGGFFQNIGKWFTNLFKKFVNWIFKGVAKSMGPYFIYLFANPAKIKSPEIRRRRAEQQRTFNWIAKKGRLNHDQLKGTILNGIKSKTGATPQEIFLAGEVPQIAGITIGSIVTAVISAITWVIKTIEKIISLFKGKKEEAGTIGKQNMSDPTLFEEEAKLQKGTQAGAGSGGVGIAALASLIGILAFQ